MWQRLVVWVYARTPDPLRRAVLRRSNPRYSVGALAVVRRPDGRILLVDQPYVEGWSLPGGDVKRRETVEQAVERELWEEVGLRVRVDAPAGAHQRVHDRWVTFTFVVAVDDAVADRARPVSPEIRQVGWFAADSLPPVHRDAAPALALGGRG